MSTEEGEPTSVPACTCPVGETGITGHSDDCPVKKAQQENQSEVARLLAQINSEYEAGHQGLSGFAQGIGQHKFITKRMEQIAEYHSQLRNLVGDEAMRLIDEQLDDPEETAP